MYMLQSKHHRTIGLTGSEDREITASLRLDLMGHGRETTGCASAGLGSAPWSGMRIFTGLLISANFL
jgi:hypothetical protein